MFTIKNFDIFKANHGIFFISVSNDAGMEVTFCSMGASVYSLKLDIEPLILSYRDFETFYHSSSYQGKTIGRISGRIKDGLLTINDQTYQLDKNDGLYIDPINIVNILPDVLKEVKEDNIYVF